MKLNYTNILLFSLSLNILSLSPKVYNQRNHKSITPHTPKEHPIKIHRSLCECELYMPNYDNDPEMQAVMQDFGRQTSQRFEENNECMIENRQKCKEQCDKEIQKIILKDKIEKELTVKFGALHTHITIEDIPTCICDKSLSDKVEKTCLNCGGILGTVVPGWGILGSIGFYGFVNSIAIDVAVKEGIAKVLHELKEITALEILLNNKLEALVTPETYACTNALNKSIMAAKLTICKASPQPAPCSPKLFDLSVIAPKVHNATMEGINTAKVAEVNTWNTAFSSPAFFSNPIVISAIVLICIAVILLIIYLILRYRRKKQMNKKLKYIKLLKE
ncbi:hypothetical protein PFNF135_02829 [Plasmodium falciparum NF135/5.C10]|uniref:Surface antigen n=1 Tax=Plasmodium falciparum NF135/5.C10 TaxID=1036726 RepID=W4IIK7_PLAFA|nr:hypothetical protein PFNF135_02829 [Plasmodium falciparum NF135/5.C10]